MIPSCHANLVGLFAVETKMADEAYCMYHLILEQELAATQRNRLQPVRYWKTRDSAVRLASAVVVGGAQALAGVRSCDGRTEKPAAKGSVREDAR